MLRIISLAFCLFIASIVCNDQKLVSLTNDDVVCGPVTCGLNTTCMCFHTSRLTRDSANNTYISSCGTCLSRNGSTVRENCGTEPTSVTNYTNSLTISLLNSTVDENRFRNSITGLLLSEMNMAGGIPFRPSVLVTPPPSTVPNQPPIIVVQPPAQQIYFNQQPAGGFDVNSNVNRPLLGSTFCTPPDSPECLRNPPPKFHPNGLPPQLNKVYNDIRSMHQMLDRMQATIQDMSAGLPIGYLNDGAKFPPEKPFPVFTPPFK